MWPQQPMYNQFMPQQIMPPQSAPVQQVIQQVQKSAQFYTVESAQELDGIKPALNVLYVGFNKKAKEIYIKQLTNDGLISIETYSLVTDKKERSDFEKILEKIDNLERRFDNAKHISNNDAENDNGSVGTDTRDATSQTNVAG